MKDSEPKSEQTKALEQKAIGLYERIYNKPDDTRTSEEVVLISLHTDRGMEFMGNDNISSYDFRSLVSIVFSEGRTLHRFLVPGVAFTRYFQLKELGPFRILVERERGYGAPFELNPNSKNIFSVHTDMPGLLISQKK